MIKVEYIMENHIELQYSFLWKDAEYSTVKRELIIHLKKQNTKKARNYITYKLALVKLNIIIISKGERKIINKYKLKIVLIMFCMATIIGSFCLTNATEETVSGNVLHVDETENSVNVMGGGGVYMRI